MRGLLSIFFCNKNNQGTQRRNYVGCLDYVRLAWVVFANFSGLFVQEVDSISFLWNNRHNSIYYFDIPNITS